MNMKDMITFGSIVKFRDGRLAVALRRIDPKESHYKYVFYGLNDMSSVVSRAGIINLDEYDDNLNIKEGDALSKYDIMAIADPSYVIGGPSYVIGGPRIAVEVIKAMFGFVTEDEILWNWKREDVIEVTMEAVEKKFGCKVKIVKEEN